MGWYPLKRFYVPFGYHVFLPVCSTFKVLICIIFRYKDVPFERDSFCTFFPHFFLYEVRTAHCYFSQHLYYLNFRCVLALHNSHLFMKQTLSSKANYLCHCMQMTGNSNIQYIQSDHPRWMLRQSVNVVLCKSKTIFQTASIQLHEHES